MSEDKGASMIKYRIVINGIEISMPYKKPNNRFIGTKIFVEYNQNLDIDYIGYMEFNFIGFPSSDLLKFTIKEFYDFLKTKALKQTYSYARFQSIEQGNEEHLRLTTQFKNKIEEHLGIKL